MSLLKYSGHFREARASVASLPVVDFGIVAEMWQLQAEFEFERKDARSLPCLFVLLSSLPLPLSLSFFVTVSQHCPPKGLFILYQVMLVLMGVKLV
jgi:hypothetical protein